MPRDSSPSSRSMVFQSMQPTFDFSDAFQRSMMTSDRVCIKIPATLQSIIAFQSLEKIVSAPFALGCSQSHKRSPHLTRDAHMSRLISMVRPNLLHVCRSELYCVHCRAMGALRPYPMERVRKYVEGPPKVFRYS